MIHLTLTDPEAGELLCALDALLVELESELAAAPEEPVKGQLEEAFLQLLRVRDRLLPAVQIPRLHAVC